MGIGTHQHPHQGGATRGEGVTGRSLPLALLVWCCLFDFRRNITARIWEEEKAANKDPAHIAIPSPAAPSVPPSPPPLLPPPSHPAIAHFLLWPRTGLASIWARNRLPPAAAREQAGCLGIYSVAP